MYKAKSLYYKVFNKVTFLKEDAKEFLRSERGDTNFISMMIILGIALAIAITFISFKDKIFTFVSERFNQFKTNTNNIAGKNFP